VGRRPNSCGSSSRTSTHAAPLGVGPLGETGSEHWCPEHATARRLLMARTAHGPACVEHRLAVGRTVAPSRDHVAGAALSPRGILTDRPAKADFAGARREALAVRGSRD
jgi:hypothetical protein